VCVCVCACACACVRVRVSFVRVCVGVCTCQPFCVTEQDFARHAIDPMVPQILPFGDADHPNVTIISGKEVDELVTREIAEKKAAGVINMQPPYNLSDPLIQFAHAMPGYRPANYVSHITPENMNETLGWELGESWLRSISDARRNRTYQDDWNHYFELIQEGKLPKDTCNTTIGLEDYYEYIQMLNKELLEASQYGNTSGMERLIEMGADVNYSELDPDFGYTPLIHAAGSGEIQAMHILLDLGACVHDVSVYNGSALHYAASNGRLEACHLLLHHGADPCAFAEWGGTPMEWALERILLPGAFEVVHLLAPLTHDDAQLGRSHPRPWLGPRDTQDWYWEGVNASGIELSAHGWWGRNGHLFPDDDPDERLEYWDAMKAAKKFQKEEMAKLRKKGARRPDDPLPPSRPIADSTQLFGTPGKQGLQIGEYVDNSGGLDLALLDSSWQRQGWRFEQHEAYKPAPNTTKHKTRRPRVRKLLD